MLQDAKELYVVCKNWNEALEHIELVKENNLKIVKTEISKNGNIRLYY